MLPLLCRIYNAETDKARGGYQCNGNIYYLQCLTLGSNR